MRNKILISLTLLLGIILALMIFFNRQKESESELDFNINLNMNSTEEIEGLIIETLLEGDGLEAENGKMVTVHYTGKLENGRIFDSSVERGIAFQFVLGAGMVIQGWEKGVLGMRVGEKRLLKISPELAYGPRGIVAPDGTVVIPENATLIFEVELLDVTEAD